MTRQRCADKNVNLAGKRRAQLPGISGHRVRLAGYEPHTAIPGRSGGNNPRSVCFYPAHIAFFAAFRFFYLIAYFYCFFGVFVVK